MDKSLGPRIDRVLHAIGVARKYLQFYPPNNPAVVESIEDLHDAVKAVNTYLAAPEQFVPASPLGPLEDSAPAPEDLPSHFTIDIVRGGARFNGQGVGENNPTVQKFSEELYRIGVTGIEIQPEVTSTELRDFLQFSYMAPDAIEKKGGIEAVLESVAAPHIRVHLAERLAVVDKDSLPDELSFEDYIRRGAGRGIGPATGHGEGRSVNAISEFFARASEGVDEDHRYLLQTLSDANRLAEALEHIASTDEPEDPGAATDASILTNTLDQISTIIQGLPQDQRTHIVTNMAQAILAADKQTRQKVVGEGLAGRLGEGGIQEDILKNLSDTDVAEALSSHVRLHEGTSNTVENFLDEFVADPTRRHVIQNTTLRLLADNEDDRLKEIAEALRSGSTFEVAPPGASALLDADIVVDHEARARISKGLRLHEYELQDVAQAAVKDYKSQTLDQSMRIFFELYIADSLHPIGDATRREFVRLMIAAVEQHRYECIAELFELLIEEMSPDARAQASPPMQAVLHEISCGMHISTIIQQLSGLRPKTASHRRLVYLLSLMGDKASSSLFRRLETEKNRVTRMFLVSLFVEMGESIVPFLNRNIHHKLWYVVRNVVYILGKIGSETAVDTIAEALQHNEPRVRREALKALAVIKGEHAENAVMRCLSDPDPHFRALAAEWLGHMNATRILPSFLELLKSRRRALIKEEEFAAGVIRAIGLMGGPDEAEAIRRFTPRKPLMGSQKRSELIDVCDEAIARIERNRTAAERPA